MWFRFRGFRVFGRTIGLVGQRLRFDVNLGDCLFMVDGLSILRFQAGFHDTSLEYCSSPGFTVESSANTNNRQPPWSIGGKRRKVKG